MLTTPATVRSCRVVVCALAIWALCGCASIYHRAGEEEAAGPESRLTTHVREALANARSAAAAIDNTPPGDSVLARRVEPRAWDLSKSVASMHDVADRAELAGGASGVLSAFDRAEADLGAAVQAIQGADPDPQPLLQRASDSLRVAIASADSYLDDATALHARP